MEFKTHTHTGHPDTTMKRYTLSSIEKQIMKIQLPG